MPLPPTGGETEAGKRPVWLDSGSKLGVPAPGQLSEDRLFFRTSRIIPTFLSGKAADRSVTAERRIRAVTRRPGARPQPRLR